MVDENDSSTVLINSISQNDQDSQEKPVGNVFGPNVLPTAKETMEQARLKARAAKAKTETERTGILLGADEGAIYEATLNIADGKNRKILYDINKIKKIDDGVVPSTTKGRGSLININPSNSMVTQKMGDVKPFDENNSFAISRMLPRAGESGQVIKRFLDNVLAKLGNEDARERAFVARARALYAKALRENVGIQEQLYRRDAHAENAEARTESPAEVSDAMAAEDGEKINPFRATVLPTAAERFGARKAGENNPSTADAVPLPLHKGGETAEVRAEKTKPEVREESTMAEEAESEGGKAVYDGMTEEEYDAMADVQEAEDSMAGHSMLYEDGRQYSIRKEKEVAKRDGKQYNKKQINMNSQEHTLVKSAIMKKESARTDGDIPNVDSVYAYDKYYLYEPASGYDGVVFARFDPIYDQRAINEIEEGLKSGTVRDKKALSGRIKAFRGGKRFGVMHNGNDENGRTSDGTAGVHGSELGSNDVGHPGGGVRNQSGFGLDQESGKSEATLRLQYEQQIREDAYLSELARRRENWEIDDVAYEKLYNEYVSTNPELMEQEAKIMRAARDRARLAVTRSNESDGRQFSISKGNGAEKDNQNIYNNSNNKTGGIEDGRKMGDDSLRRRGESENPGKQNTTGETGSGRAKSDGQETRFGLHGGRGREDIYAKDNEGRRIRIEDAERLKDTAIKDGSGNPIAVYHFTPNLDFEVFAKGDTGFHFGNEAQARKRAKADTLFEKAYRQGVVVSTDYYEQYKHVLK